MAIRIRRGNLIDFDKDKLVQGELAIVLDAGELHFCYGAGNTKRLATKEDLQEVLDTSPEAYQALMQLIDDLEDNPSGVTDILNALADLKANVTGNNGELYHARLRVIGGVPHIEYEEV